MSSFSKQSRIKLDNTGLIHMASKNKNWGNIFRLSVTLKNEVDPEVLQNALNATIKRFPTVTARIFKGFFWFYQAPVDKAPQIIKDNKSLLKPMSDEEMGKSAFRVLYYEKNIHVEIFHSITDGKGAIVFLNSLVAEYLRQKENIKISAGTVVLDLDERPLKEEMSDAYHSIETQPQSKYKEEIKPIYQITDEETDKLNQTKFTLEIDEIKKISKKMNVSITVLITAIIIKALINIQNEDEKSKKRRAVKVFLPINLRGLFPSNTLRNFVLYIKPIINPKEQNGTLEEIAVSVNDQLKAGLSIEEIRGRVQKNIKLEENLIVKFIPLFLKRILLKYSFLFSEKSTSMTVSNLGIAKIPEEMESHIDSFDIILNTRSGTPYNCGIISYGNYININFIRNISTPILEQEFSNIIQQLELNYSEKNTTYNR